MRVPSTRPVRPRQRHALGEGAIGQLRAREIGQRAVRQACNAFNAGDERRRGLPGWHLSCRDDQVERVQRGGDDFCHVVARRIGKLLDDRDAAKGFNDCCAHGCSSRLVRPLDHAVGVLRGNRLSEDRRPERRRSVGLRIADELEHIPVLGRLAFLVHPEDVDDCHPVVVGIVVDEVVEHAVGVHVVTDGDGAVVHEAGVLVLRRDLREVVDDPLGPVLEQGIVLDVIGTRVLLDRFLRPLLVDHHLVPSDDVFQVAHGSAVAGVDALDYHSCTLRLCGSFLQCLDLHFCLGLDLL